MEGAALQPLFGVIFAVEFENLLDENEVLRVRAPGDGYNFQSSDGVRPIAWKHPRGSVVLS